MTASVANVSLNGVSPVRTVVIVLYAQRTFCSSSGHTPFAPSCLVLIILSKFLLVTSVWPWPEGVLEKSSDFLLLNLGKIFETWGCQIVFHCLIL